MQPKPWTRYACERELLVVYLYICEARVLNVSHVAGTIVVLIRERARDYECLGKR